MLSMSTPKNTHIYRLWHPTIKTHQLEKLTCLMFLWRGATSACERVLSIFARRFSLMQNLSNSPLCLVRTMPAFLRWGILLFYSRSNADCQFLSGILIIAERLTTASSSVASPPLGIPRPMLYICFSVSVFASVNILSGNQ
jgi:hypothetical protein